MAHSKPVGTSAKHTTGCPEEGKRRMRTFCVSAYQEGRKWNRTFSSVVCFLLDNLGYSDDMRKFRECAYDIIADDISRKVDFFGVSVFATGSKSEGASMLLQSDDDYMYATDNILCVEHNSRSSDFYTLKAERNDSVPPGYTRVVAVHTGGPSWLGLICSGSVVYFTEDGLPYVSSALFNNFLRKAGSSFNFSSYLGVNNDQVSYSGPAFTRQSSGFLNFGGISLPSFEANVDAVCSIYFYSSQYTSKLAARLTRREWFSPSLIDIICSTEGFIVPVGSIEGEDPDLEWRISYVMTENKIIRNLSTTQFKLYVIMKMIAKELINFPVMSSYVVKPVISSYVVKNVVLWICELNSQVSDPNPRVYELISRQDLLLYQIAKCLSFMRTCVINNHLPNYVIPERNLIASRLTLESKQQLLDHLDGLLNEGRNIFCRLKIFIKHSSLSLVLTPSSVFFYGRKRDEIEKLCLLVNRLMQKHFQIDQSSRATLLLEIMGETFCDQGYFPLALKLMNLVVPEWTTLVSSGQLQVISDLYDARVQQYLS